ncbi:hypothetical protein VP01_15388g1, partial [Puccinia sorghi]
KISKLLRLKASLPAKQLNDGFRQAMLKATLDMTPQLTDENYSVWKDKMSGLLELRGVLDALKSP